MPDTIEQIAMKAAVTLSTEKLSVSGNSRALSESESEDDSDDPSSDDYSSSEDYTSSSSCLSSADEAKFRFLLPKPPQTKVIEPISNMKKSSSMTKFDDEMSTLQVASLLSQARICDAKNQTKTMRRSSLSHHNSSFSTSLHHIQGERLHAGNRKSKEAVSPTALYNDTLVSAGFTPKVLACDQVNNFFLGVTADRISGYSKDIISAIKGSDLNFLRMAHFDLKRNMNCCNRFGESVLHTACRHGNLEVVKFLMQEAKVDIRVRDDYGRTPAHDACWQAEPNMELIELIIAQWPDLMLIADKRGFTPLQYVRKAQWPAWAEMFDQNHGKFLPKRLLKPGENFIAVSA